MTETDAIPKKYMLKKAKTHKGRLHIADTLPKVVEDPKQCAYINTNNSSEIMKLVLQELYLMRTSFSVRLQKKNILGHVFENPHNIEYLTGKNNCGLFAYSSDTKKRPMNLVLGNLFNAKLLDMFEFEVTNFIPASFFETKVKFEPNSQPILIFSGEQFETEKCLERFKKFVMDYFKQDYLEEVNITDLKRILVFCVDAEGTVKVRSYQTFSNTEYSLHDIKLEETGPSFDLKPRRNHLAPDDEYKLACKQPITIKGINKKNRINSLIDVKAKVFTSKQNLEAASLKRYDRLLARKRKTNTEALEMVKAENKAVNAIKDEKRKESASKNTSKARPPKKDGKSKSKSKPKKLDNDN